MADELELELDEVELDEEELLLDVEEEVLEDVEDVEEVVEELDVLEVDEEDVRVEELLDELAMLEGMLEEELVRLDEDEELDDDVVEVGDPEPMKKYPPIATTAIITTTAPAITVVLAALRSLPIADSPGLDDPRFPNIVDRLSPRVCLYHFFNHCRVGARQCASPGRAARELLSMFQGHPRPLFHTRPGHGNRRKDKIYVE